MAAIETTSDSLLALDIGAITTRALFFDVVNGQYRFVAAGSAPTTAGAPFHNVLEGAHMAIDDLQRITGRRLLADDATVIIPSLSPGEGVDGMVTTLSAGAPLKTVVIGLLEDVSVASAHRLVKSIHARLVDTFTLSDRRSLETRLDALLRLRPDLVIVTGGTENGASVSVSRLLEPLRLALRLMPPEERPQILFAGNSALQEKISTIFEDTARVWLAPNVRPALDEEQIAAAHTILARALREHYIRRLSGLQELDAWSGGVTMPAATAQGRMVRFLSLDDPSKGVLAVDMGASSITVTAAFQGRQYLGAYTDLGLGPQAAGVTRGDPHATLLPWLTLPLEADTVRDYVFNKTLQPAALPLTEEETAIEYAMARYALHRAAHRLLRDMYAQGTNDTAGVPELFPPIEPIIITGGIFTQTANLGKALLTALDGLQPTGITTILLDRYNLTTALGAAASINPALAVQAMDSTMFIRLGLVVAPISIARPGTPVLKVQLTDNESGETLKGEVKQGGLAVLPLPPGRRGTLRLQPLYRTDIGLGAGRKAAYEVSGSALGIVIDARGRPLRLHKDMARRQEMYKKWLWHLGH